MCAAERDPISIHVGGNMTGQFVVGDNNTTVSVSNALPTGGPRPSGSTPPGPAPAGAKRIFVSYVREDLATVDVLVTSLRNAGYRVWIDHDSLLPGMRWQQEIRTAIAAGDYFLACFSPRYWKPQTYMNEELTIAITRLRQMPRTRNWFIPIILEPCELPDFPVGPGETISDTIQYADFSTNWETALGQLVAAIGPPEHTRPT
ncbi:MAG TPA: toll/interleukin-1 receptor domain-containing protein [Pseudonocardiaceae bacterium]|jgi:hypothetical protein|nr:toll/interleukin-1 receptor domain-containing protein [Pseudonocardiaceae bacterium]